MRSLHLFVCSCVSLYVLYLSSIFYFQRLLLTYKRTVFNWVKGIEWLYKLEIGYSKLFRNVETDLSAFQDYMIWDNI